MMLTKEELLDCVKSMDPGERQHLLKLLAGFAERRDLSFLTEIPSMGEGEQQYVFKCPDCRNAHITEMHDQFTCPHCGWKELIDGE